MTGRRHDLNGDDTPRPGDYGKLADGKWYACTPEGTFVNLHRHAVIPHPDGTITVRGMIRTKNSHGWVGYLERGEWRVLA